MQCAACVRPPPRLCLRMETAGRRLASGCKVGLGFGRTPPCLTARALRCAAGGAPQPGGPGGNGRERPVPRPAGRVRRRAAGRPARPEPVWAAGRGVRPRAHLDPGRFSWTKPVSSWGGRALSHLLAALAWCRGLPFRYPSALCAVSCCALLQAGGSTVTPCIRAPLMHAQVLVVNWPAGPAIF